ncbi:tetratricopeptide repeat protein [Maribacter sp. CXY002]|uniref:tetratricopeptide repeat protein n=1 Tax=Maribacter luteocoastalis TaxID=3407671 RepID=UPI003B68407E
MKTINYFIVLLLIICVNSFGQDRKKELDSLIQRAKSLPEDTLKAQVLSRIHERMMFMDNEGALEYARQAQQLSEKIGYEKGVANGFVQFGNYYYNQSKNDSAQFFHNKALDKFKEINSVRGQIFAMHSLATIEREKGNYAKAIALTTSILAMYTEENRKNSDLGEFDLRGSEYEVLGGIYFEKGNYKLALENTLKSLKSFEEVEDEVRQGDALKQLADIEYQLGNFPSSLIYAEQAITIYKKNDDKIYHSYASNTAGLAAEKLNNTTLAEKYQTESIDLAREMNVQSMISQSLNDLARLSYTQGDYQKAGNLLNESLQIARKEDIKLDLTEVLHELANLGMAQDNPERALVYIEEVVSIATEIGALPTLSDAMKTRANIWHMLNKNDVAFADFKEYHTLNDSIYNLKKNQQIEELQTIFETEKKEAEIELQQEEINTLNEKAKVDQLTKGLYAGGMFTFVAVSGLLFFGFKQRIKKNRIAREKQEEIYKQEIEHKQKELASQTLHLVQKNTFIQELMENLEHIKNSPEKFKMEFRRIVMLLKKENASDKDWEVFKTYFAEVHNDFDQKLKTIYTDISEKEIRLAAFLRMNLTTKEIAATLNVLPDSILKSKYRLKKKLGLDKETDLNTFLSAL